MKSFVDYREEQTHCDEWAQGELIIVDPTAKDVRFIRKKGKQSLQLLYKGFLLIIGIIIIIRRGNFRLLFLLFILILLLLTLVSFVFFFFTFKNVVTFSVRGLIVYEVLCYAGYVCPIIEGPWTVEWAFFIDVHIQVLLLCKIGMLQV